MVKTRSDLKGVRVSVKAPRKMPASASSSPAGRSSRKYDGGNSYCPRETPEWQKEITKFFTTKESTKDCSTSSVPETSSAGETLQN